ncbi:MAG TPA: SRPBCC family protein [Actinoplanes sp.]|nr:SRPBCC family protein [Actinoplanes sp.]
MTRTPTGRLFGTDLVLTRTFPAPVDDVWASVTEPERTARWFGRWEGEAAPGRTIKVQMAYEEEQPWIEMRIETCEPPHRLALYARDDYGVWNVELQLSEQDGRTELRFVHHLENTDEIGETGPGWEYYLDQLVAARDGTPGPSFDDYYPAMKPYFQALRTAPRD